MKKFKILSLVVCCVLCIVGFSGCSLSSLGFGLSAYEVAVKNGFTGTEQEWLQSLQGDYSQWQNKIDELEDKIESLLNELENDDMNAQYATNLAMRSSVKILTDSSTGSGTIIAYDTNTNKAHILTCFHVIVDTNNKINYASSNIQIQFYGTENTNLTYNAKFLGGASYSDVAILEVDISKSVWEQFDLNVATMDTNKVSNGKTCIAIGNTKNKGLNAVRGNVSLSSQLTSIGNITGLSGTSTLRVIRVNAILAHGNSGGGLFDAKGNLIGMINAKSSNEKEQNFSYAIPANVTYGIYVNILNQIVQNGGKIGIMPVKCKLGLNLEIQNLSCEYDQTNMDYSSIQEVVVDNSSVTEIKKNDVLYEATLKRSNEDIMTIKITSVYDLGELMWYAKVGDTLTFKYKRDYSISYVSVGITKTHANLYLIREELKYA